MKALIVGLALALAALVALFVLCERDRSSREEQHVLETLLRA